MRWIAELVGYPADCGGLLVSGGNMANLVCFLTGRRAILGDGVRSGGLASERQLRVYVSAETHTWVQKAADLFGLGTDAIRWIPTDREGRMDVPALRARFEVRCRRRGPASHAGRHGRNGRDRGGGSAPRAGRGRTGTRDLVPRGRGIRRTGGGATGRAGGPQGARARGLAGGGSAQVALRPARGWMRAGARGGPSAAGLQLHPDLLSFRDRRARSRRSTTTSSACRTPAASAR